MGNEVKELDENAKREKIIKEIVKYRKRYINILLINVILGLLLAFIGLGSYYINMGRSATDKPIIYLYPEEEMNVSVSLGYPDQITCSYPKYIEGWNVQAKSNGDLKDLDTGKGLYSLYYEAENSYQYKVEDEGFAVKGEDVADFLEEKLSILGLTARESEEFIVYWLPKLEANKYNYIRFATEEEINRNMPLNISPKPDTLIRVIMTFKGLDKPIKVKEQKLEQRTREGFVVVEWGASEIK